MVEFFYIGCFMSVDEGECWGFFNKFVGVEVLESEVVVFVE